MSHFLANCDYKRFRRWASKVGRLTGAHQTEPSFILVPSSKGEICLCLVCCEQSDALFKEDRDLEWI